MEAAGEKAQMQEDIAAVAKRLFQRVFQGLSVIVCGGFAHAFAACQTACDGQDDEACGSECVKCALPGNGGDEDQGLQDGGENGLPHGAAGVDDARCGAAQARRQFVGNLAHEDGMAAGAGAEGHHDAEGEEQAVVVWP